MQTKQTTKKIFSNLLDITKSLLANNQAQQYDVIRAQLELTEIENRIIEISKNVQLVKAKLIRWVGRPYENQLNPKIFPHFPEVLDIAELQNSIKRHPQILVSRANTQAMKKDVGWACEQYKPGITTGVNYSIRQGRNLDHSKRSDFLSLTIKMDLPLFPGNRQDRRVKASQSRLVSSQEDEAIHYRNLTAELDSQYAIWQESQKKVSLYTKKLIPQAQQYAEASLLAYKNGHVDFPTVARSFVRELDTKIEGVQAKIARDKAQVNLLYLQGNDNV